MHGDTTTTMCASIAGFYAGAKICHIEAGLRTFNKLAPFPEEINRTITGHVVIIIFLQIQTSYNNLIREGIIEKKISVTGNTVIDALLESVARVENFTNEKIELLKKSLDLNKRTIL